MEPKVSALQTISINSIQNNVKVRMKTDELFLCLMSVFYIEHIVPLTMKTFWYLKGSYDFRSIDAILVVTEKSIDLWYHVV